MMCNALLAQTFPYNINKKKFPLGEDFEKILPLKIGDWKRYAFHDFVIGNENGTVFYRKEEKQILVSFGKAYSQDNLNSSWMKIYDDVLSRSKKSKSKISQASVKNTKYVLMQSNYDQYFAWTRNLYYFSIQTKNKLDADDFMKLFPY